MMSRTMAEVVGACCLALVILATPAPAAVGQGESANFSLNTVSIVSVGHDLAPADRLAPCFPNPFNPRTTIEFELALPSAVRLAIYDLRGRQVRALAVDAPHAAGRHTVVWDGLDDSGRESAAGVYLCRLVVGEFTASRTMALVR